MSLKHHVILITGAGGGLGSTAALTLAKNGAHVILLDKNIAKLEAVYDAILAANAPEPIIYPFDLAGANENEYQELADKIDEEYGSLQGLLHSAVEFSSFTPICQFSTKDWGHTLNVNLNAPFLLTGCYCRYCKRVSMLLLYSRLILQPEKLTPTQALMACPK